MGRLAAWRRAYEHRAWPLGASLQRVFHAFGLDVAAYHHSLPQLAAFYLAAYAMSAGVQVVYLLSDYANTGSFGRNYNVLLFFAPYSNYRGVIWAFVLASAVLFVRFLALMRAALLLELQHRCRIESYSVLLLNVPSEAQDYEIRTMFFNALGRDAVARYFRVDGPQFLGARRRLYALQREYFDYLQLCGPAAGRRRCSCRRGPLAALLQLAGFMRDADYYRRAIRRQRAALERLERRARVRLDAVVVTLDSRAARRAFARAFRRAPARLRGRRLALRRAPGPTDIILENLHYEGAAKGLKVAASFAVVALVSLVFFVLVGFCRFYMRRAREAEGTLRAQNVRYYGLFVLQLVFDVCLRPLLYLATSLERHYSYSEKERLWMVKLYIYTGLNKLSMFYSRQFLQLLRIFETRGLQPSFFNIYDFTRDWRTSFDQGGTDALLYALTAALAYPALDLLEYALYYACMCGAARTAADVARAARSVPERYASRYACLIVMFTFALAFGHAQPLVLLLLPLYCALHGLAARFLLLRAAGKPPTTCALSAQAENLMYAAVLFAGLALCQSYLPIGRCGEWCAALLPPLAALALLARLGLLDAALGARGRPRAPRDAPLDLAACEHYELPKEEVSAELLRDAEQRLAPARGLLGACERVY